MLSPKKLIPKGKDWWAYGLAIEVIPSLPEQLPGQPEFLEGDKVTIKINAYDVTLKRGRRASPITAARAPYVGSILRRFTGLLGEIMFTFTTWSPWVGSESGIGSMRSGTCARFAQTVMPCFTVHGRF